MKIVVTSALLAACLIGVSTAQASETLAQKNSCFACHAKDTKVLGPAFTEVAKRYGSQPDAVAVISAGIRKGGSGKWGSIPMPANENLSAEDTTALSNWILSLGK
jgi:cytochrome c